MLFLFLSYFIKYVVMYSVKSLFGMRIKFVCMYVKSLGPEMLHQIHKSH